MSQHSQILAELGYKKRLAFNPRQADGIRSDGQPYASRCLVSERKKAERQRARLLEDIALARELGISLDDLQGETE